MRDQISGTIGTPPHAAKASNAINKTGLFIVDPAY